MNDQTEHEVQLCRAIKNGMVSLQCELPDGHEGWHKGVYYDRSEVTYLGSHHVVERTETVTWEPLDHVKEAVRHMMADRHPDAGMAQP
jgi:hypothetical protein